MSLIETVVGIEYPLQGLTGTTRSVAIADPCLQEAAEGEAPDTELETLVPDLPVIQWRALAQELIASSDNLI